MLGLRMVWGLLVVGLVGAGCAASAADTETTLESPGEEPRAGVPRGEGIAAANGCAGCHQDADPGAGTLSGQTTPRPRTLAFGANLTPDEETGIGRWSDAQIDAAIRRGVDDEGKPLCQAMPRFASMSAADARALIAYLRSLAPVSREIPQSSCRAPR